jgi:hypothetical protein
MALMQIRKVVVQTLPPGGEFLGQVAEGRYTWEDGVVTLVNDDGVPMTDRKGKPYEKKLTAQEDPHTIAGRLAKQRFHDQGGGKKDFWRPLNYKPIVY